MLKALHIRNLALVKELTVEFGPGLNVVTGETGAGKSLILGAVQLLLGGRAGPGIVRRGEDQCEIAAVFSHSGARTEVRRAVASLLTEFDIETPDEGELHVRRVVTASGSRAYVNGSSVTMSFLRTLGSGLIDIHGPHEHQSLLKPSCQLELLDSYAQRQDEAQRCADVWARLRDARAALASARAEILNEDETEFVRFQLREIDAADLAPDEEHDLVERHRICSHARSLVEMAGQCRVGLAEADGCVADQLAPFVRLMGDMAAIDPERGDAFREAVETIVMSVQDLAGDLGDYADSIELDAGELAQLDDRLTLVQKLKRKYGPTLADVLESAETMRLKLAAAESRQQRLLDLEAEAMRLEAVHLQVCAKLAEDRREAAPRLGSAISDKLRRLGFAQGIVDVVLRPVDPGPTGADAVEFGFAPNPGEPMMPLRQVASSGEMARVSLAIKTVLTAADNVPVLIFDEVDANIGGRVAVVVAEELTAIAAEHQVLSITHLPQIAAAGHHHFEVTKQVQDGRTLAMMHRLVGAARENELVRMLGADCDSVAAAGHARELLVKAGTPTVSSKTEPRAAERPRTGHMTNAD